MKASIGALSVFNTLIFSSFYTVLKFDNCFDVASVKASRVEGKHHG